MVKTYFHGFLSSDKLNFIIFFLYQNQLPKVNRSKLNKRRIAIANGDYDDAILSTNDNDNGGVAVVAAVTRLRAQIARNLPECR